MLNEVKHLYLDWKAPRQQERFFAPLTSSRHLHPLQMRCVLRENDIREVLILFPASQYN
jgi:hypothetical protein